MKCCLSLVLMLEPRVLNMLVKHTLLETVVLRWVLSSYRPCWPQTYCEAEYELDLPTSTF